MTTLSGFTLVAENIGEGFSINDANGTTFYDSDNGFSASLSNGRYSLNASSKVNSIGQGDWNNGSLVGGVPGTLQYTITGDITNGTLVGATTINEDGSAEVTITPSEGYRTPQSYADITVTNARQTSYHPNNGKLGIASPSGNVTITATCPAIPATYPITCYVTNGSYAGSTTIRENNTATVDIIPASGYVAPPEQDVTVVGASYTYDINTNTKRGRVTLSEPTGDVSIVATCPSETPTTYTITGNVTNGTLSGATTIDADGTATVTFVPNAGYEIPTGLDVIAIGARWSYDDTTGVVTLSNPTRDVTVTGTCPAEAETYTITGSIANGSLSGDNTITSGSTATCTIVPATGYDLPASGGVTVSGATGSYDDQTGVVSISDPRGTVIVTATCPLAAGYYSITGSISHGTLTGDTVIAENGRATVTIVPDQGYKLWVDGTSVTNCLVTLDASTGVMQLSFPTGNVAISSQCEAILVPIENGDSLTYIRVDRTIPNNTIKSYLNQVPVTMETDPETGGQAGYVSLVECSNVGNEDTGHSIVDLYKFIDGSTSEVTYQIAVGTGEDPQSHDISYEVIYSSTNGWSHLTNGQIALSFATTPVVDGLEQTTVTVGGQQISAWNGRVIGQ